MSDFESEKTNSERPLDTKTVFFIPVGDFFAMPKCEIYIVYAPLSNITFITSATQCLKIAHQIDTKNASPSSEELIKKLKQTSKIPEWNIPPPEDFEEIEILPNFDCNFRCSYCYAANSRGNIRLSLRKMIGATNYFFRQKYQSKKIRISFLGGGEPLLAWPEILETIRYADSKSIASHREISYCFITNGSILSDEMLNVFKSHRTYIRVSFDILPDIQNRQRGCYERVANNIITLINNGIHVALRAIITPESVDRMSEMVTFVQKNFPKVEKIDLEPVSMSFISSALAKEFYRKYIHHFFLAVKKADEAGIKLDSITRRMSSTIKSRYCPGDFCITPEGKITICHRIASANDPNHDSFMYGKIFNDGSIHIDRSKYYTIQNKKRINNFYSCDSCYAKYNCGGGCLVQRANFAPWLFDAFCDFTKDFLREYILYNMNRQLCASCGTTLHEYISDITRNRENNV